MGINKIQNNSIKNMRTKPTFKNIAITAIFIFTTMAINAQNVESKSNAKCTAKSNTAYGGIISKEHASNYGSFVVDAYIIAKDTTYVDSLNVELPAILTLSAVNNLQGVTIFSFDTGYTNYK